MLGPPLPPVTVEFVKVTALPAPVISIALPSVFTSERPLRSVRSLAFNVPLTWKIREAPCASRDWPLPVIVTGTMMSSCPCCRAIDVLAKAASNTIVSLLPKLPLLVLLHGSDSANAAVSTAVIALRNVHPVGVALSPPSLTEIEIAPAFTAPSAKVMPRARGQRCEADAIAMAITVDRDQ